MVTILLLKLREKESFAQFTCILIVYLQKNGVQETKCEKEKIPKELNIEGYHTYWLSGDKEGYSGVGMYSKEKPINVTYGIGTRYVLHKFATVNVKLGTFTLTSVHNEFGYKEHLALMKEFLCIKINDRTHLQRAVL